MNSEGGVGQHGQSSHLPESIQSGLELSQKIEALTTQNPSFKPFVERSIQVLERCLSLYGVGGTAFSFNAGKDSVVVLHCIRAALTRVYMRKATELRALEQEEPRSTSETDLQQKREELNKINLSNVPIIYFEHDNEFKEIRDFVAYLADQYKVSYRVFTGRFQDDLEVFLRETDVKAIVMGVRKGDPYSETLEHFSPSSEGWPLFMRVNPVLKWEYCHVWEFLRGCGLEYCCLYDQGYTSLGKVVDTEKNPALQRVDSHGNVTYLPAYALKNGRQERVGRKRKVESNDSAIKNDGRAGNAAAVVILSSAGEDAVEDQNEVRRNSCSILDGKETKLTKDIVEGLVSLNVTVPQVSYLVPKKNSFEQEMKRLASENTYVFILDFGCPNFVSDRLDTIFSFKEIHLENQEESNLKVLAVNNVAVFRGSMDGICGHLGAILDKLDD
jgi:FAD synthetase